GMVCSNPDCQKMTCGPTEDPAHAVNIGVAAHITAASKGGPRYDPLLTEAQRSSAENGIWLCQNCAKLVDNDKDCYTTELLRQWKFRAEDVARKNCAQTTRNSEKKWQIVYVEDDDTDRLLFSYWIRRHTGFQLEDFGTAEDGCRFINENASHIGAIILDMMM